MRYSGSRAERRLILSLDGSEMPAREDLPAALEPMVSRNAIRLNLETFRRDVRSLVEALEELVPGVGPTAAGEPPKALLWSHTMTRRRLLRAALGAAALGATGLGLWSLSRLDRGGPLWVFATGDEVYSSPAVVDGVVYIGSTDQHLYAIDAATGAERWRYRADGAVTSSPAVVDGAVYVGCNDARLHVVDAGTGVRRWTFSTGAVIHSSPAVDQGIVFVGSRDQNVYAIDAQTGQQRWRFTGGDWFNSSPTVAGDAVYIGCRDHNIYALDAATGAKRWDTQSTVGGAGPPLVVEVGCTASGGLDANVSVERGTHELGRAGTSTCTQSTPPPAMNALTTRPRCSEWPLCRSDPTFALDAIPAQTQPPA